MRGHTATDHAIDRKRPDTEFHRDLVSPNSTTRVERRKNGMEFEQQERQRASMSRLARYVGAGMLAVGLVAGGAAAVFAASPDPSTSPAPQSTTAPDQSGGSSGGTTNGGTPSTHPNCPKDQQSTDSTNNSTTTSSTNSSV